MQSSQRYIEVAVSLGVIERDYARQLAQWLLGKTAGDARAQLLEHNLITHDQDRAIAAAMARGAGGKVPAAQGSVTDLTYLPAGAAPSITVGGLRTLVEMRSPPATQRASAAGSTAKLPASAQQSKFKPVRELGKGGMGVVALHADAAIGRQVAIKTLLRATDPSAVERFVEEGQVTGQLEHPNIVPVYDLDRDEHERPYIVMKCVRGRTLADVLDAVLRGELTSLDATLPLDATRGELTAPGGTPRTLRGTERLRRGTVRRARTGGPTAGRAKTAQAGAGDAVRTPEQWLTRLLDLFIKVCDAIAFAHARGVIHRDLKPDNIMVGQFGEVLVMDWGLAKVIGRDDENAATDRELVESVRTMSGDTARTQEGAIAGTPMYMSPEQAEGRIAELDQRSDVYALGAVLYEILTLNHPFDADNVYELLAKVARANLAPPRSRSRAPWRIPPELQSIALMAMSHSKARRYPTATALKNDIEAYQSNAPVSAHHDNPLQALTKWTKRHPTTAMAGALVMVFALLGGLLVGQLQLAQAQADREKAERAGADERADREAAEATLARAREAAALGKLEEVRDLLVVNATEHRDAAITEFMELYAEKERKRQSPDAFAAEIGETRLRDYLAAYDRLIEVVAQETDYEPTDKDYFNRAFVRSYLPNTDWEASIRDYTRAIRLRPQLASAYFNRGNAYLNTGHLQRALADFDETVRLEPDEMSYVGRGRIYVQMGQPQRAIEDYDAALRIDPDYSNAYAARGYALAALNQFERAIEDYTEAIRLNPDSRQAYTGRGDAYNAQQRFALAVDDFTEALRVDCNHVESFAGRGNAHAQLGNYGEALADLNEAIRLDPKNYGAYVNRGLTYGFVNQGERAIEDFDHAIGLDPQRWHAFANKGLALRGMGQPAAAGRAFQDAYRRCADPGMRQRLAGMLETVGAPIPD